SSIGSLQRTGKFALRYLRVIDSFNRTKRPRTHWTPANKYETMRNEEVDYPNRDRRGRPAGDRAGCGLFLPQFDREKGRRYGWPQTHQGGSAPRQRQTIAALRQRPAFRPLCRQPGRVSNAFSPQAERHQTGGG